MAPSPRQRASRGLRFALTIDFLCVRTVNTMLASTEPGCCMSNGREHRSASTTSLVLECDEGRRSRASSRRGDLAVLRPPRVKLDHPQPACSIVEQSSDTAKRRLGHGRYWNRTEAAVPPPAAILAPIRMRCRPGSHQRRANRQKHVQPRRLDLGRLVRTGHESASLSWGKVVAQRRRSRRIFCVFARARRSRHC